MFGRLTTAVVLAALALDLALGASALAGAVTYGDGVFRYRASAGEKVELDLFLLPSENRGDGGPTLWEAETRPGVWVGPGCSARPHERWGLLVLCEALPSETGRSSRYRLSLSDRNDRVEISARRGVTYAGPGRDTVFDSEAAVFGGSGGDLLHGLTVYGGTGDDSLSHPPGLDGPPWGFLHGGRGDDALFGSGALYGGPGDDRLEDSSYGADLLVGGPGRDLVIFDEWDDYRDVVRLRGGGADRIRCDSGFYESDIFFVDESDHVAPACRSARILLSGRPRDLRDPGDLRPL